MLLLALPLVAVLAGAAAGGLRNRAQRAPAGGPPLAAALEGHDGEVGSGSSSASPRACVAPLLAAACLLVLAAAGVLGLRDAWGRVRVAQQLRRCRPPRGRGRLEAWGDLQGFHHPILTATPEAQSLFNQGLLLMWDFNRPEALLSFQGCRHLDPGAAMCAWGEAQAAGPFLNRVPGPPGSKAGYPTFGPAEFAHSHAAAARAVRLAEAAAAAARKDSSGSGGGGTARRELLYCRAVAARFAAGSDSQPARDAAERAYAAEMERIGAALQDPTALALAAEAWMNLRAWDFVDSQGRQRPEAAAAEALLLRTLRLQPAHPFALHLHVHLAELGQRQEDAPGMPNATAAMARGKGSADALRGLHPRMGHLQHMPSHLYLRLGQYHEAVQTNVDAYEADLENSRLCLQAYIPEHNLQLLLYAASMAGQLAAVERWAQRLWGVADAMPLSVWPGRERTLLLLTQVRFGMWDQVLACPPPARYERGPGECGGNEYARAMWHFARSLALASGAQHAQERGDWQGGKQHRAGAERELHQLKQVAAAAPRDLITRPGQGVGIYSPGYNDLCAIAAHVAEARLAAASGDWRAAVAALRAGAEVEGGMGYAEPPRLLQPVRQCLGWALLQAGSLEAAAEEYEADLRQHPANGWSLLGLSQASMLAGHSARGAEVQARFRQAWVHADRPLHSSCPAFST